MDIDSVRMLLHEMVTGQPAVAGSSLLTGALGAVAGLAVALAAYGLLRRHWRHEGLDAPAPEVPWGEGRSFLGAARGVSQSRGGGERGLPTLSWRRWWALPTWADGAGLRSV
jgi:hypothetical protein